MSDALEQSTRRYLQKVLTCDPVHDSDAIVQYRNQFLKIDPLPDSDLHGHDYSNVQELRVQASRMLDDIRSRFWEYSDPELMAAIARIDLKALPDLKFAVMRLSYVAERRDEFKEIEAHDSCVPEILNDIRRLLLMSRSTAGPERERLVKKLDADSVRDASKMLEMMRSEHKGLYGLERDWFDHIIAQGKKQESEKWVYIAIVIGALLLVVAALFSQ